MYYILSKKFQKNGGPCFDQIGIIIADTIERAAEKVGLPIVQGWDPLTPAIKDSWLELEHNFHLDSIPEWDGKLPKEESDETENPKQHPEPSNIAVMPLGGTPDIQTNLWLRNPRF